MVFLLFMILLLSFLFVFIVVYLLLHHCSLVVSSAFIWFHFFLFLSVFLGCPFMIISPFCSNHQSGESFLMSFFSLSFCLHAPLHRWKWWCLTHLLCCLFLWSLIFISIISYNCYPPRCLTQTQTLLRPKLFWHTRVPHDARRIHSNRMTLVTSCPNIHIWHRDVQTTYPDNNVFGAVLIHQNSPTRCT